MDISDFVSKERCVILSNTRKNEALLEMLEIIENQKAVKDMEELRKEIFYREQLMSTGIGMSIAVPHVRFSGVESPIVIVGVSPQGISDYVSLDSQLIQIVIMIIVAKDHHREYIRLLSILMSHLKDEAVRESLIKAKDADEILKIMREL